MQRRLIRVCISVAIVAFCLFLYVDRHILAPSPNILSGPSTGQTTSGSEPPNVAGVPDLNGNTDKSDKYLRGNDSTRLESLRQMYRTGLISGLDYQRLVREAKNPPPTPSDEELLEQSLAMLKKGNLAYSTPEKMKSGHTAHVTARIGSGKVSVQTLESGLPTDQGAQTGIAVTPVSTKMKVTLKGADFDITPLSSEEQIVAGDTPTQWEWDVVPKHSGKLRLHLAAIVELNNLSRDFTTVDREITVQVDPVDMAETFAEKNLIWILGTLGTAIVGGWAWWKRRKKPEAPSWQVP